MMESSYDAADDLKRYVQVVLTPDNSRVLVSLWLSDRRSFMYLDATTGEPIQGGIYQPEPHQVTCSKDAIQINKLGDKFFYLAMRPETKTVSLQGVSFDGLAFENFSQYRWLANDSAGAVELQKWSLLISPDN